MQLDRMWIVQQGDTAFGGKGVADHEVPVTVHEINGHAGVRQFPYRHFHLCVVGIRIIVAYPGFEQVAKDIERIGVAGRTSQEGQELLANLWPARLKV